MVTSGQIKVERTMMKCGTVNEIIAKANWTHVDLISLDVENAEMYVLKSIDWKKLDVSVWVIELSSEGIGPFMESKGYELRECTPTQPQTLPQPHPQLQSRWSCCNLIGMKANLIGGHRPSSFDASPL